MVSYTEILTSNTLITSSTAPLISVFIGGTSGVGQLTIRALVATGVSSKIYLVGRALSSSRTHLFIQELHALNPLAEVLWIEGEISLLVEVSRICRIIASKESRIDLLFLTAGYAPFSARSETVEGIETSQSLAYYSRILFILHLLPLLNKAGSPRVVSVLAGGMERTNLDLEDLDLKKPGSFNVVKAHMHYGPMNTMSMERLAGENPGVTFIHSSPGWVNTGNVRRGLDPNRQNSFMAWFVWLILDPLISLLALSDEEAGQRHLFLSTSGALGRRGVPWKGKQDINSLGKPENGLYLVSPKCDCTPNAKAVSWLREKAMERIWEHTQEVLRTYL